MKALRKSQRPIFSPLKSWQTRRSGQMREELNILSWGVFAFISALLQERKLLFSIQDSFRGRISPQWARFCPLKAKVYKYGPWTIPKTSGNHESASHLVARCGQKKNVTYISQGRTSPQMSLNMKTVRFCLVLAPAGLASDQRYVTQTLLSLSKGVLTKTAAKQTSSFLWSFCCGPLPSLPHSLSGAWPTSITFLGAWNIEKGFTVRCKRDSYWPNQATVALWCLRLQPRFPVCKPAAGDNHK